MPESQLMKTIEIIYNTSLVMSFIGIVGLPFFSMTIIGFMALKELCDSARDFGIRNIRKWNRGMVWFTIKEAIGYGVFSIATVICILITVIKSILWLIHHITIS
jgi:hypothetical protein